MDLAAKKTVLRMFTYGLYAVTSHAQGQVGAMTVNFLTQSAFEPPMVALAVQNEARSLRLIRASGTFAVNIFAAEHREQAGRLGRASAKLPNKLEGIAWHPGPRGNPVLEQALGFLECQVRAEVPSGDHTLIVAEVVEAGVLRDGEPLTMQATGFRHFG